MLSSVCAPLTLRIHVKKLSALVHVVILALRRWGSLAQLMSPRFQGETLSEKTRLTTHMEWHIKLTSGLGTHPPPPPRGNHGATLVIENDIKFPLCLKVQIIRGHKGSHPLRQLELGPLLTREISVWEFLTLTNSSILCYTGDGTQGYMHAR